MNLREKAQAEINLALHKGDEKYGDTLEESLAKTYTDREILKAIGHLLQHMQGETIDPDDDVMHLGLAGARIIRALMCKIKRKGDA